MPKQQKNKYITESTKIPERLTLDDPFYGFKLDGDQLNFVNAMLNPNNIGVFCNAKAGTGKAQPTNTILPTPNGNKKLGELIAGDYVFDENNKPTQVLGIFPQGKKEVYKISFEDGRSSLCSKDHLWNIYYNNNKQPETCSLEDIINKISYSQNKYSDYFIIKNKVTETNKEEKLNIINIEDMKYETEMACILVDNPTHLYLTNDYIVTHNTTLAIATANILIKGNRFDRCYYVVSPTMEARMGYLPGNEEEKSAPYFSPMFDALVSIKENPQLVFDEKSNFWCKGITHIYQRGANYSNCVIIVDEAQNFYADELKKILTRAHDSCLVVVIGHTGQIDLIKNRENSGFAKYIEHFKNEPYIQICELTKNYRGIFSNKADELIC